MVLSVLASVFSGKQHINSRTSEAGFISGVGRLSILKAALPLHDTKKGNEYQWHAQKLESMTLESI